MMNIGIEGMIMATEVITKEKILVYLRKRRDYILNMMIERHKKMDEVNCCELETLFTYNAIISDIKHDKLES